jgi:Phosphorylated CTD interacting factor 1 WW domain
MEMLNYYESFMIAQQQRFIALKALNQRDSYEMGNILERWAIATCQAESALHVITEATEKMRAEMKEKRINDINRRINGILNVKIPKSRACQLTITCGQVVDKLDDEPHYKIKYGMFERVLSESRLKLMREFASDDEILICALKYEALFPGSQQWNIPKAVYDIMITDYGVSLEAFASPFNSQIMAHKKQFCSLFADTDAVFGSIGNFFTADISAHTNITVNPPFIISVMDAAVQCIIDECVDRRANGGQFRAFITVPSWTDADYFIKLSESQFLTHAISKNKGEYYYEDCAANKKIPARFNSTMFVLSVGFNEFSVDDISRAFSL